LLFTDTGFGRPRALLSDTPCCDSVLPIDEQLMTHVATCWHVLTLPHVDIAMWWHSLLQPLTHCNLNLWHMLTLFVYIRWIRQCSSCGLSSSCHPKTMILVIGTLKIESPSTALLSSIASPPIAMVTSIVSPPSAVTSSGVVESFIKTYKWTFNIGFSMSVFVYEKILYILYRII